METGSSILSEVLKTSKWDRNPYGVVFRQIRGLMLSEFSTCLVSDCNRCLVAYGDSNVFMDYTPNFVIQMVPGD